MCIKKPLQAHVNDYLIKFSDLLNIPPLILDELLKQEIK